MVNGKKNKVQSCTYWVILTMLTKAKAVFGNRPETSISKWLKKRKQSSMSHGMELCDFFPSF